MPRKTKMTLWEEKRAEEQKARDEAFEAAIKANPELYRELRNAVRDSQVAYREIDKKYRPLSLVEAQASSLKKGLEQFGLTAEAAIAGGLMAILEKQIAPISAARATAIEVYEAAERAFSEHFPDAY